MDKAWPENKRIRTKARLRERLEQERRRQVTSDCEKGSSEREITSHLPEVVWKERERERRKRSADHIQHEIRRDTSAQRSLIRLR
jgi:hypothetical protein